MHEELIKRLRAEALFQRMSFSRGLLASELEEAATALEAQSAQLAAKDAEIEQMRKSFKDFVDGLTFSHDNVYARLARVTAERNAAVELLGKLDRCVMLLDAAKESIAPNPAVRQTICFAVNAMEDWRTPAKQDEEETDHEH